MAATHDRNVSVTATYTDARQARAGLVALERAGVEAGRIRLESSAVGRRPSEGALRGIDMDASRYMGSRIGVGAIIGFVVGALVGGGAGAAVSAVTDFPLMWAVLTGALGGGIIVGPVLGGIFGGEVALPVDNEDLATTFEAPDAPVLLRVVAADEHEVDRVEHALDGTGATEIRRAS